LGKRITSPGLGWINYVWNVTCYGHVWMLLRAGHAKPLAGQKLAEESAALGLKINAAWAREQGQAKSRLPSK
jgi:hypothetical protein